MKLYATHPEVKSIETWGNVPGDGLLIDQDYMNAIQKAAEVKASIVNYLDAPENAHDTYYSYGKHLKERGYTNVYYSWYTEIENQLLTWDVEVTDEAKTAYHKLYPYTTQVIQTAIGKLHAKHQKSYPKLCNVFSNGTFNFYMYYEDPSKFISLTNMPKLGS